MLKEQLNQLYEEYGYRKFRMSKLRTMTCMPRTRIF